MAHSCSLALQHTDFVMQLLRDLGFIINLAKSDMAHQNFIFPGTLVGHFDPFIGSTAG